METDSNEKPKNEEENDGILDAVKQYQSRQQDYTCLIPEDMEPLVVVNHKDKPATIATKETKESFKFSPGEGKIPSNFLRTEHMDVKAFPRHHPSGQYGLHHDQQFKLNP